MIWNWISTFKAGVGSLSLASLWQKSHNNLSADWNSAWKNSTFLHLSTLYWDRHSQLITVILENTCCYLLLLCFLEKTKQNKKQKHKKQNQKKKTKTQPPPVQADWLLKQVMFLTLNSSLPTIMSAGLCGAETDQFTWLKLSPQIFYLVVNLWCKVDLRESNNKWNKMQDGEKKTRREECSKAAL